MLLSELNETSPLPVLLFVQSETYEIGTGNAYDGSVLSVYGQIVVVTVNYRLGILGESDMLVHIPEVGVGYT